jgi:hypothetical protein
VKPTRVLAMLAAVFTLSAVAANPAMATTVEECQGKLTELRNATVNSGLTAKQIESLVPKIDTASDKLDAGKTADAIQKLVDFQDKLDQFVASGKVEPGVAGALRAQAQGVINCIKIGI